MVDVGRVFLHPTNHPMEKKKRFVTKIVTSPVAQNGDTVLANGIAAVQNV